MEAGQKSALGDPAGLVTGHAHVCTHLAWSQSCRGLRQLDEKSPNHRLRVNVTGTTRLTSTAIGEVDQRNRDVPTVIRPNCSVYHQFRVANIRSGSHPVVSGRIVLGPRHAKIEGTGVPGRENGFGELAEDRGTSIVFAGIVLTVGKGVTLSMAKQVLSGRMDRVIKTIERNVDLV